MSRRSIKPIKKSDVDNYMKNLRYTNDTDAASFTTDESFSTAPHAFAPLSSSSSSSSSLSSSSFLPTISSSSSADRRINDDDDDVDDGAASSVSVSVSPAAELAKALQQRADDYATRQNAISDRLVALRTKETQLADALAALYELCESCAKNGSDAIDKYINVSRWMAVVDDDLREEKSESILMDMVGVSSTMKLDIRQSLDEIAQASRPTSLVSVLSSRLATPFSRLVIANQNLRRATAGQKRPFKTTLMTIALVRQDALSWFSKNNV